MMMMLMMVGPLYEFVERRLRGHMEINTDSPEQTARLQRPTRKRSRWCRAPQDRRRRHRRQPRQEYGSSCLIARGTGARRMTMTKLRRWRRVRRLGRPPPRPRRYRRRRNDFDSHRAPFGSARTTGKSQSLLSPAPSDFPKASFGKGHKK